MLHILSISMKENIKQKCSTFTFDFLLSELTNSGWIGWLKGLRRQLSMGKSPEKMEFGKGKVREFYFR